MAALKTIITQNYNDKFGFKIVDSSLDKVIIIGKKWWHTQTCAKKDAASVLKDWRSLTKRAFVKPGA